jgi:hypothetical protein
MKPSQFISIVSLLTALSCGLALFTLDYEWASRAAGLWIAFYYTFLILLQYEDKDGTPR